jgi:hypothetical protein
MATDRLSINFVVSNMKKKSNKPLFAATCVTCGAVATELNPLYKMRKEKRTKLFCGIDAAEAEQNGWIHVK